MPIKANNTDRYRAVRVCSMVHNELLRRAQENGTSICKELERAVLGKVITKSQGRPKKTAIDNN